MEKKLYIKPGFYYDTETRFLNGPKKAADRRLEPRHINLFLKAYQNYDHTIVAKGKLKQGDVSFINQRGASVGLPKQSVFAPLGDDVYMMQICGLEADYPDTSQIVNAMSNLESPIELSKLIVGANVCRNRKINGCSKNSPIKNWFLSDSDGSREEDLKAAYFSEVAGVIDCLSLHHQSVLIDYHHQLKISVSDWPKRPYLVSSTVKQRRAGIGVNAFSTRNLYADRQRAESFRYTGIRLFDEDGNEFLTLSDLPSFSNDMTDREFDKRTATPEGWTKRYDIGTWQLERRGDLVGYFCLSFIKKDEGASQYIVTIRSWECCSTERSWSNEAIEKGAPVVDEGNSYHSADITIVSPEGSDISIEISCEYRARAVVYEAQFDAPVFAPAVQVELVDESNNRDFRFSLEQISSLSPLLRRSNPRDTIEDRLSFGSRDSRHLSWRYDDQWLMAGEGYSIVVDAMKAHVI